MSLNALLGIARDGIITHQGALQVTGNNVANVNTPGYVRQSPVMQTRGAPGAPMNGVELESVRRSFNIFAYRHTVVESGHRGAADARSGALAQIEAILAPGEGLGVEDRVAELFAAFRNLATDADDPTMRQQVLAAATDLAQSLQSTATGLAEQRSQLVDRAQIMSNDINDGLAQVATLNGAIMEAEAKGTPANNLKDQRDELIRELSGQMGIRPVEDDKGGMTLFSAGTVLVEGTNAGRISVGLDPGNGDMVFSLTRGSSGSGIDITRNVTSGALAGLKEARDVDLADTVSQLDQFAFDLAGAINGAHSGGFGLDGNSGRNLFTTPAAVAGAAYAFSIDPVMVGQPDFVAAAGNAADVPGGNSAALALADLESQPFGGTGSPGESFAAILGSFGVRKTAADAEYSLRQATVAEAEALQQQGAGVSLDEEMIFLNQFQTAFEASTRVLRVADELLETIIRGV